MKDGIVEMDIVIPVNDTHVIIRFNYINKGKRIKENLMFKKGRIGKEIELPDVLDEEFKYLKPEEYDVYAAKSPDT